MFGSVRILQVHVIAGNERPCWSKVTWLLQLLSCRQTPRKKFDLVVCLALSVMAVHAESTPSGSLGSDVCAMVVSAPEVRERSGRV